MNANRFDPNTIRLLRATVEEAWEALPARQQELFTRSYLAERVLRLAAQGERDQGRLCAEALAELD